jgi:hypothetical protein
MSPQTAAVLTELRQTADAVFTILADDGSAITVLVEPGDNSLPAFVMRIDPQCFHAPSDNVFN